MDSMANRFGNTAQALQQQGGGAYAQVGSQLAQGVQQGQQALMSTLQGLQARHAKAMARKQIDPRLKNFANQPAPQLQTPQLGSSAPGAQVGGVMGRNASTLGAPAPQAGGQMQPGQGGLSPNMARRLAGNQGQLGQGPKATLMSSDRLAQVLGY